MFLLPPFLLPPIVKPLQLGLGFILGWMARGHSVAERLEAKR